MGEYSDTQPVLLGFLLGSIRKVAARHTSIADLSIMTNYQYIPSEEISQAIIGDIDCTRLKKLVDEV